MNKKNSLISDIVACLMDGIAIKITSGVLEEPYCTLVSGGYANYHNGVVSKNWKTEYWEETLPTPIENRFEILDFGEK